jgi:hypothetical protein
MWEELVYRISQRGALAITYVCNAYALLYELICRRIRGGRSLVAGEALQRIIQIRGEDHFRVDISLHR